MNRIPENKKSIRELRIRNGLTQTEAAEALNITATTYAKWENRTSDLTIAKVKRMANLYGVTMDDIFLP